MLKLLNLLWQLTRFQGAGEILRRIWMLKHDLEPWDVDPGGAGGGAAGEYATLKDWQLHLSTIFPEVRLRTYIEMRGADGGPAEHIVALSALWVGLLYDRYRSVCWEEWGGGWGGWCWLWAGGRVDYTGRYCRICRKMGLSTGFPLISLRSREISRRL